MWDLWKITYWVSFIQLQTNIFLTEAIACSQSSSNCSSRSRSHFCITFLISVWSRECSILIRIGEKMSCVFPINHKWIYVADGRSVHLEVFNLCQDKTTELKVSIEMFRCNVIFLLDLLKVHQYITLTNIANKPDTFLLSIVKYTILNFRGKLIFSGQRYWCKGWSIFPKMLSIVSLGSDCIIKNRVTLDVQRTLFFSIVREFAQEE